MTVRELLSAFKRGQISRDELRRQLLQHEVANEPLSEGQQGLWMLQSAKPTSFAYNIPLCLRLQGRLDEKALEGALYEVMRSHRMLASAIVERDGRPQRRSLAPDTLSLTRHAAVHLDDASLMEAMSVRLQQPFVLDEGPLMRADLYSHTDEVWHLLLVVHHIAFDGGSVAVFMQTLCATYERLAKGLSTAATQMSALDFGAFVQWERDFVASEAGAASLQFWKQKLHGATPVLGLGLATADPCRPHTLRHALDADATQKIRSLCARLRITPASFFLSMYQALLGSVSGKSDITIGMAVERRRHEGFDHTVGCFVNLVAVRSTSEFAASLDDRLRSTHAGLTEVLAHADYPFQRVARALHQRGDGSSQLFDTVFEYKSRRFFALPSTRREWAGVRFEPVEGLYQEGEYALAFKVAEQESGYILYFDHDASQVAEYTAESWLHSIVIAIDAALRPERSVDHGAVLPEQVAWCPLHEAIGVQCQRYPQVPAVVHETAQLSYAELDARSNSLAEHLQRAGVAADSLVGVLLERSIDAVCALLAVWKAGGAYLALDPELPAERLRFMIEDAAPVTIVTREQLRERLPCAVEHMVLVEAITGTAVGHVAPVVVPGQLAYVIYTSGSTGTPKAVAVPHAGLANLALTQAEAFGVTAGERVLQFAPWTFDASVWEMAMALQAGATLHLAPGGSLQRSGQLAELMQQHRINVATLPPSALTLLESVDLPELRLLIVAGEACAPALAARWSRRCRFVNAYGPTETTVCATFKTCDPVPPIVGDATRGASDPDVSLPSGSLSIGRAIRGTSTVVLNPETLQPIAPGQVGELFVGGISLARGYLRRPGLTAENFIANPSGPPGSRLYRTGDRVRELADGELQFVQRVDAQVKIRGSRVELGEVETVLQAHPGVAQCAAVVLDERKQLAAFIVPSQLAGIADAAAVKTYLAKHLPDYMQPARVTLVPQLPTNANGKVDRRALAAGWQDSHTKEQHAMEHAPAIESTVRSIMREVLRVQDVALDEGFFDMGGDSILAVSVARRVAEAFDMPFDVTALLKLASVRGISRHIAEFRAGDTVQAAIATPAAAVESCGTMPDRIDDCVAIIGMSCHVPGARDHRQFWENLRNGVESIEFLSTSTLRSLGVPEALLQTPGLVTARAIIEDKDCFDAEFFNIPAHDAQAIDPQVRMLLQHAWKAVEDAGYRPSDIADAGVFMTAANAGYHGDAPPAAWSVMGGSKQYVASAWSQPGALPTVISHRLGLRGPSLFVHSNCSSSLVALHTAYRSVVAGDTRHALVGAASLSDSATLGYVAERGMNFSSDGHLRPFDERADGMLGGEGVAVLLLKRAREAIADKDPIYALLRGVAINNDGADKAGYYAPGLAGQAEVIDKVLSTSGVDVETIDYVEAHGTATRLGDPLEVAALVDAFGRHTSRHQFCGIGSVKSNIGHLDTVAGLVGCIKVALGLKHAQIPASLNYDTPNPAIDFAASPFYVVSKHLTLTPRQAPHRAGVSSFGIGGTNAHALLEEFHAPSIGTAATARCLVPLSARKPEQLRQYAVDLLSFLERYPGLDLHDIAHTLQVGREPFACRLALQASSVDELCVGLRGFIGKDALAQHRGQNGATPQWLDGGELQRLLPYWIQAGHWHKVGEVWMAGADLDWALCRTGARAPRRISLPTYPFAPTRYRRSTPALPATQEHTLHPLLHCNTSSLAEHRYTTRFSGAEFVFADHNVRGARLLPGVAYLEMARAAVAQALRSMETPILLSNVSWLRPLVAATDPLTVHVRVDRRDARNVSFQIYSQLDDAPACVHCEGTASLAPEARGEQLDIASLRGACGQPAHGDACYALFDRLGCRYGPSLRALVETAPGQAKDGTRFALGHLRLHAQAVRDWRLVLHPGLLDAALQASIGMGLVDGVLADDQLEQTLPLSVDRVSILQPPGEQAWVYVCEAAGSSQLVHKLDVRIYDAEGHLVVEMAGLSARVVAPTAAGSLSTVSELPPATLGQSLGAVPLVPVWECLGPQTAITDSGQSQRVLLIGSTPPLATSLREACGPDALCTLPADAGQAELASLILSQRPTHVVWIANDDHAGSDPQQHVLCCLRLAKALLHAGYETQPLHLAAITSGALAVHNAESGNPAQAALHGFIGALAKEYPHWAVHAFDVDHAEHCPWPMVLGAPADPERSSTVIRGHNRYAQRLIPAVLPAALPTRLVEGGVYVVLGGAGGLGQAWTDYLLRHYRANVVWLGRRSPEGEIANAVQRLSALGGSLRYLQVDARQRPALEAALKQVETEHAVIHGFIHTALSLHDRGVMAVDEAEFADALSSKILTAAALAGALARYRPAHFVLFFSALQSFNPSPGQSSYAAGSAYVDALATWLRRNGQASARVINWGYWGSVGIVASGAHRRRMAHIGEGSIEPAEAMPFIESVLAGPFEQMALLKRSAAHGGAALPIVTDDRVELATALTNGRFAMSDPSLSVELPDLALPAPPDPLDAVLASGLFHQLSVFAGGTATTLSLASLHARLAKPQVYGRWLHEALRFLCSAGYACAREDGEFEFERSASDADWATVERYFAKAGSSESERAHADLIEPMLRALPDILAGRRQATDVMFSNASVQRVEDVYKKNPYIDYYNRIVAVLVGQYAEQRLRSDSNAQLRLLEIGAGTGATSQRVFETLRPLTPSVSEYCYTDISRAFLGHAERQYRQQAPYLRCLLLDIERPLAAQGLDCGTYDVVIATNVLHATREMHRTVRHAKSGLARNGLLIINEMQGHGLFAHLTFGLLPGWWAYQDGWLRESGSPGLAPATWRRVLEEEGFRAIRFPLGETHRFGQQIIIAESDGVFRQKSTAVQPSREDQGARPPAGALPLRADPSGTETSSADAPRGAMTVYVRGLVAEVLELTADDIDADEPFESYGIDSILAIRLANALRTRFPDVSSTVIFEYSNARALAGYLQSLPTNTTAAAPVKPIASPRSTLQPRTGETDLRGIVTAYVRSIVGRTLEQPIDEIDIHEPLENYGVDSILAIRVANELRATFEDVSSTLLFEHRTVVAIAAHLLTTQADSARRLLPSAAVPTSGLFPSPPAVAEVADPFATPPLAPAQVAAAPHEDRAIAIIGVSGRYPQAATLDAFWERLRCGEDCITEIPAERWSLDGFFDADPASAIAQGCSYSKWGGFIDGFADFDPLFFGIAPREAMAIDPHERLFLQESWRAFEDAGYTRASLVSRHARRVGVFAGVSQSGFERCASGQDPDGNAICPQTSFGSVANRVSYLLDLQGPSMPIDTMCSSSLTAIHEACEHLLRDECDVAVAGGVNLNLHPSRYVASCEGRFLSTSGRCRSFGAGGDGFVPGEGVGVLVLKRLSQAISDGDSIHAVIRSTSINHGGKAKGYTAPNPAAQRELIKAAIRKAGISARDISHVEAHGTGTELGDPIEIDALTQAFRGSTIERGFCALSSVKSNIGHLEAAAGVAGVTKVLLQLKHRQLVPSLHAEVPNPHIDFDSSPFRLQRELASWNPPASGLGKRIASVSSFGAGGSNAHVIIEEYVAHPSPATAAHGPYLVLLSAKDDARLDDYVRSLLQACGALDESQLVDVAYTLQVAREAMEVRFGCVVQSLAELQDSLERFLREKTTSGDVRYGDTRNARKTLSWLRDDDDIQTLLATWLARGKLERLLEVWVAGASHIDWEQLYPQARPRRISLPTYPFAKERYWMEASAPASSVAAHAMSALHPLVQRNTSSIHGLRFSSTFKGNEPVFADHVVAGQAILPAVAYLEMAQAAATLALNVEQVSSLRISDVVWLKPVMAGPAPLHLHIQVTPQDTDLVCEFLLDEDARGADGSHASTAPCARAKVSMQPQVGAVRDIAALRAALSGAPMDGDSCYRELSAMGVVYGPSHRGLVELQAGQDAEGRFVLARLCLPALADAGRLGLPPGLLDSAVQAAGFLHDVAAASDSHGPASVPFALDSLQWFFPCPRDGWAIVRQMTSGLAQTHIDICDDTGRLCVRLQGLTGRTYRSGSGVTGTAQTIFMAPAPAPLPALPAHDQHEQRIVLACDLPAAAMAPFASASQSKILQSTATDPAERFSAYAEQLLDVLGTLQRQRTGQTTLLQVLVPQRGTGRLHAGLAALLRGAELETRGLRTQLLVLDHPQASPVAAVPGMPRGDALVEIEPPSRGTTGPWRDHGVYLITGGLGGIGRAVVADIARSVRSATIIIACRSDLDTGRREHLAELVALGVRVEYRRVDVSHRAQVDELVEEIVRHFGCLHGVLHCAGSAHSRLLAALTASELHEVLATKALGARYLDLATRHLALDCFVLFSSLTTRTGAIGQAAYATANAFLDEYAQYRHELQALGERSGRSLSLALPYWATDGGMQLPADMVQVMRRQGFVPLDAQTGVDALARALATDLPQLAVAHGQPAQIRRLLLGSTAAGTGMPTPEPERVPPTTQTIDALREFLARHLMIAPARIHANATFDAFGIDSVVAVRLTAALDKQYGPLSKTLFFEHATVADLAAHLAGQRRLPSAEVAPPSGAILPPAEQTMADTGADVSMKPGSDVAIIGLAGRYPQSPTLEAFWENLKAGVDCISEIPSDRWDMASFFDAEQGVPGKSYSKWGGFIDGVADFDPSFFNISPREAPMMDPQERLFLMCAHDAMEDAGYTREALNLNAQARGAGVGVFVGVMHTEYQLYGATAQVGGEPLVLGSGIASVANRVSYFGNFQGPSLAVDTMCSSSLTAIHLACQSLRDGDCSVAIAGGVNVSLHPNKYLGLSQAKFASSTGRCAAFGDGGDGYVPGEGVGAVLLKPLDKAIADGDRIYGVIKGSGINHGGRSNGFTVPSATAQSQLIGRVLERSGVSPRAIGYVEAHGTGTALGDPIEVAGLTRALRNGTQDTQFCAIGSVKSNIGHCESAAGIAGLTKILLQMKYAMLVPTLHAQRLNPNIDFAQTPFVVQRTLEPWQSQRDSNGISLPRTAALSSFGAGGANAHVVVEEFHPAARTIPDPHAPPGPDLILLSARAPDRLMQAARDLRAVLSTVPHDPAELHAIARALQTGREHHVHRLGLSAWSIAEVCEKLQAFIQGDRHNVACGEVDEAAMSVLSPTELAAMLERGEERRLMDAWVTGAQCPWDSLYHERYLPSLRLPGYPFARTRYWAPDLLGARRLASVPMEPSGHRSAGTTDAPGSQTTAPPVAVPVNTSNSPPAPAPAPARGNGSELRRIERILCETLAEVLYMKVADIGVRTAFVDLGMDSVMGVEWLPMIQQELGVALGATKIYEYPTLSELAVFVLSQLPSTALEEPPPAQQRSIDEWLQAIYDGTASPDDAPHWLQVQHAASAGGRHAH